jgi:hypothetical protein
VNLSLRDRETDGPVHFLVARNGTPEHPAPSSDYQYIRSRVNGESWSAAGFFEPYDRRFIAKWFGQEAAQDGVLLKGSGRISYDNSCTAWRWDEATLHYRDGEVENYRFYFTHGMHKGRDNWEPFSRLTRLLDPSTTNDRTLDENFESVLDFESFIRTIGPRMMVNDGDALFVGNGHNGFLFWDPTEDKWHYLGVDFGSWVFRASGDLLTVRDANLARLMRRPRPRRLYYNMLNDYMHGYWDPVATDLYFTELDQMAGVTDGGGIRSSRRTVLSRLEPFVEAPLRFLARPGDDVVVESIIAAPPAVTLWGEAPVTMDSFLLQKDDGPPAAFEPEFTSPTEWVTTIAIGDEGKTVQVFGFDRAGTLTGTASVTIVIAQPTEFIRGDVDGDSKVDVRDPLTTLLALFRGGLLLCPDAADVNDDGRIDVTDVLMGLGFMFSSASLPPPPFPTPGPDPSADGLECRR